MSFKFNPLINMGLDNVLSASEVLAIVGGGITWKEPVDDTASLPLTGNAENDARFVKDTDELYVWSTPASSGVIGDWVQIGASVSASWGTIIGTLSDQTDLQNALDAKADDADLTSHEGDTNNPHEVAADQVNTDQSGETVQSKLDDLDTNKANTVHTHVEADITDLDKYTQSEVDGLVDAKADDADLTSHVNDTNNPHDVVASQIPTDVSGETVQSNLDDLDTNKANTVHTHVEADITDLDKYTQAEVDGLVDANTDDITDLKDSAIQVPFSTDATGPAVYFEMPFAGTITEARLFADQTGDLVVDLYKDTYANFPPTIADTITASAKPTISSSDKSEDTTLTGWTTSFAQGDIILINVDSVTDITSATLSLRITRT